MRGGCLVRPTVSALLEHVAAALQREADHEASKTSEGARPAASKADTPSGAAYAFWVRRTGCDGGLPNILACTDETLGKCV